MSNDSFKNGVRHGEQGKPIPPQRDRSAQEYKDFVAGVRQGEKK